ncbi:MAG: phosphoglycerate mutase family protein [Bacteroidota bacterium]
MKKWIGLVTLIGWLSTCSAPKGPMERATVVERIEETAVYLVGGAKRTLPQMNPAEARCFFLVRHAEKAKEGKDPALNSAGKARAEKLTQLLESAGIQQLFSSDYQRTRSTVAPLAQKLGLATTIYPPREQKTFFENYLRSNTSPRTLVVGHSNTIPQLLNFLTGTENYQTLAHEAYDDLFVVCLQRNTKDSASVMELKYGNNSSKQLKQH